jgi:hypothetical protein
MTSYIRNLMGLIGNFARHIQLSDPDIFVAYVVKLQKSEINEGQSVVSKKET